MHVITSAEHWLPLKPSEEEWRDGESSWLWDICIRCWVKEPAERPIMLDLLAGIMLGDPHLLNIRIFSESDLKKGNHTCDSVFTYTYKAHLHMAAQSSSSGPQNSDNTEWKTVAVKRLKIYAYGREGVKAVRIAPLALNLRMIGV